jgi:hypothetical protein
MVCGIYQDKHSRWAGTVRSVYSEAGLTGKLAISPTRHHTLFLHLACWVFHAQEKFPTKRTEFYKEGLDLLLGKWDEARGVERDNVYRGFYYHKAEVVESDRGGNV